jgi:hypothetical protein
MPQKWRDDKMRTDADIRPGQGFEDSRNKPSQSGDYSPGGGGARPYPGYPGPDESLRYGGVPPANTSIRSVRVGNVAGYGAGELGPMEIAGKTVNPTKVPPMQKFDPRPITGPGPLEEQRLTQQQNNAIAMGDPDYSPFRELDYESIKDANFGRPSQKSAKRPDKDFGR